MRPRGFPRALRIRRKADFEAAFRDGAYASDELLAVHARANGGAEPRLGLAVGRSVGGAVARNRVKRLLRESFRLHRGELPPSHDLVVVPRTADAASRPLADFERSLVAVAARAADRLARGGGGRRRSSRGGAPGAEGRGERG